MHFQWGTRFCALGHTQAAELWVPALFLGGRAAGAWRWPPTTFSAEVKEGVELYLYSSSGQILCSLRVSYLVCYSGIRQNLRPWIPQHFCRRTVGSTKKAIQSLCGQVAKLVILIRTCTRGEKQLSNQCLVFEYTVCISVSGLRKFYVSDWSDCIWNADISGVWYSERTVLFVVKCCPVMKRWNCCCCCCCCNFPTTAVIVGWVYVLGTSPHSAFLFSECSFVS